MNPDDNPTTEAGPIVFAYDGSELADLAIRKAGKLLGHDKQALIVCVWQPFDVGFLPPEGARFNAQQMPEVKHAAEQTAEQGAKLAAEVGFSAQPLAVEATPTWKGIVKTADDNDACLIVLGSHGRTGIRGALVGSVASTVASHSRRSVFIAHKQGE